MTQPNTKKKQLQVSVGTDGIPSSSAVVRDEVLSEIAVNPRKSTEEPENAADGAHSAPTKKKTEVIPVKSTKLAVKCPTEKKKTEVIPVKSTKLAVQTKTDADRAPAAAASPATNEKKKNKVKKSPKEKMSPVMEATMDEKAPKRFTRASNKRPLPSAILTEDVPSELLLDYIHIVSTFEAMTIIT
jgi:hypothetical protein